MKIPDAFSARIGANPGWKCDDCGLELPEFPYTNEEIKKQNKK